MQPTTMGPTESLFKEHRAQPLTDILSVKAIDPDRRSEIMNYVFIDLRLTETEIQGKQLHQG